LADAPGHEAATPAEQPAETVAAPVTPTASPAEQPVASVADDVGTLDDARLDIRTVGLCMDCGQLVERASDGSCPAGHPSHVIAGNAPWFDDEPLPVLPRFNLAAFFLPIIWGPAHGQWAGAFFLPIWLFADSAIAAAAARGGLLWVAAAVVIAGTLGFGAFFARKGNAVAYRRVMGRMSVAEYTRRERIWAIVCVPAGIALIAWGLYFDLVLRARF